MKKANINFITSRFRFGILLVLGIAVCIILGSIFWSNSKAQEFSIIKEAENKTTEILLQSSDDQIDQNELLAKLTRFAQENGAVRVIIGLRFDGFKSIGDLNDAEREKQKADIKIVQDDFLARLASYNVREIKQYEFMPFLAAEVDAEALEKLRQDAQFLSIQEDIAVPPLLAQSIRLINTPVSGFTGNGFLVAVLDTGVDKTHGFLGGRVISEACYSTNSAPTIASFCPGGVSQSTAPNSGLPCDLTISGCDHGTHVAGIVAGNGNGGNLDGVARNASLIAVQVFSKFTNQVGCTTTPNLPNSCFCGTGVSPCTLTLTSDYIRGLERVLAMNSTTNIAAVNMSLGGGQFTANCDATDAAAKAAIDNLRSVNIATVIASGNSGYTNALGSPACISTAVSVGSTGDGSDGACLDCVSGFSNSAFFLNLLAPGAQIYSSLPGGGFGNKQGTSMAAPHVAGAWAILKEKKPTATVTEVLTAFQNTGVPITDTRNGIVKKRINVTAALNDICITPATITQNGQMVFNTIQTGSCRLPDGSFYRGFTFSGFAGQQISIAMNSTDFDAYLQLIPGIFPNTNPIIASDNNGGGGTNARIPANSGFFTLPSTGTYTIIANSFAVGGTGAFNLTLTRNCISAPIVVGQTINNVIRASSCIALGTTRHDAYEFSGTAGQQISIAMNSTAFDTWLILRQGAQVWQTNNDGGGGTNARIPANSGYYTLPNTGTYTIWALSNTVNGSGLYSLILSGNVAPTTRRLFDFDGDGKADVSVFRPTGGTWYLLGSQSGFTGVQFGNPTDKIVPADYDGDGKTDVAVYRGGTWYLLRSQLGFTGIAFGTADDVPVPADYDGDNKADLAVFRPSTGVWYLLQSTAGFTGIQFGQNGDAPVAGDYDGDNKADVTVYRAGIWYIQRSQLGFTGIAFGLATDKAVPADYDGDGKTDVAVFRAGTWYLLRSQLGFTGASFGQAGDLPVAADYDGDGKADIAVFRAGTWYLLQSQLGFTGIQFGAATDKPAPNAFVF